MVEKNIINEKELKIGKIKFDDKILHRSRLLKYFNNEINQKKLKKISLKSIKRLKKIENIFFQLKI